MQFGSTKCTQMVAQLLATFLMSLFIVIASSSEAAATQISAAAAIVPPAKIPWIAFDDGGDRIGVNNAETVITPSTVRKLALLWSVTTPNVVDSSVVVLPGVQTPSGMRDLLFVTTDAGSLLAIDANTGVLVWHQDTQGPVLTNSAPAIDPVSQRYVYSYGLDGKIHKYEVGTGTEITQGWPVTVTLEPGLEKGSATLNVSNKYLYMTLSSGTGDRGHYVGHVVAINLASAQMSVFNALCSDKRELLFTDSTRSNYCPDVGGGIWARGGVVVDSVTGNVFFTVGNGTYNANKGGHDYGDTVLELTPDLGTIVDTYTPTDYDALNRNDYDLGSEAPLLLPKQSTSNTPFMLVQVGKDQSIRLLNRQNLSGQGGPNHVGGELQVIKNSIYLGYTHPLVWNDANNTTWVFVADDLATYAYKVVTDAAGHSSLQLVYQTGRSSSPFIANGVLFLQDYKAVLALDPTTGSVLWKATQSSGSIQNRHWQSPVVVNGHLYFTDNNIYNHSNQSGHLYAYGINA
ncbi:MAG: PQQ-binding-like beta-propeller repeat protein [Ktedonobacteraceae bacterium]|nr:PQQ-binding-like beta-propeller repeat protein [Ktedonobacteraceae bacterium]